MKKKIVLLLLLVVGATSIAFAQSNVYGGKSGYKGMFDIGLTFDPNSEFSYFDLSTTHGYQFNPHVFLGAGFGYSFDPEGDYHTMPLYVAFRGNILKSRQIIPFAGVRLGYSVDGLSGLYFNPHIGGTFFFNNHLGLDLSVGYALQKVKLGYLSGSIHTLSIRLGVQF